MRKHIITYTNWTHINEDSEDSSNQYLDYGTDSVSIANQFEGGGYQWEGVSGVCIPLYHNGELIRSYKKGTPTHCCGFTLSIAFITATNRGLLEGKTAKQVDQFSKDWYGAGGVNGKLCVTALINLGIGKEVSLNDAKAGDFCQIWRTNGSGHSVIFLSHIIENNNIIGFNYRSSQKSTNGIGNTKEYFSGNGNGKMNKKYTYFGRMNS